MPVVRGAIIFWKQISVAFRVPPPFRCGLLVASPANPRVDCFLFRLSGFMCSNGRYIEPTRFHFVHRWCIVTHWPVLHVVSMVRFWIRNRGIVCVIARVWFDFFLFFSVIRYFVARRGTICIVTCICGHGSGIFQKKFTDRDFRVTW